MKKRRLFLAVIVGGFVFLLTACGSGGAGSGDNSFFLRGATAWAEDDVQSRGFFLLKEKIETESDGRITLEYAGGPEAIPPFELGDAVRNGVVDVAEISAAYYVPQLPAASALDYSDLSAEEERENGAMEYMNELHNETLNAQILGRAGGATGYGIYTKEPVESMEDFQGLRIRVSPIYTPFVEALGAEPVTLQGGEIYQSLERGVIDGYTWPEFGITEAGWQEQTACKVQPSYWKIDTVNLMNLDTWNELPPDLQEVVNQAAAEVETEMRAEVEAYIEEEDQTLQEAGVEICELPDAEEYQQTASDAGWEWVAQNVPSEQAGRLEELFRK